MMCNSPVSGEQILVGYNADTRSQGLARGQDSRKLGRLLSTEKGPGRPASLPFRAIVIPAGVKDKIRDPLKRTYNRRRRVLFPDVDGFREGLARRQLD